MTKKAARYPDKLVRVLAKGCLHARKMVSRARDHHYLEQHRQNSACPDNTTYVNANEFETYNAVMCPTCEIGIPKTPEPHQVIRRTPGVVVVLLGHNMTKNACGFCAWTESYSQCMQESESGTRVNSNDVQSFYNHSTYLSTTGGCGCDRGTGVGKMASYPQQQQGERSTTDNAMDDDDDNEGDLAARTQDDASDEVTEEQRKLVMKSHVNLGHPDRATFLRVLRSAHAKGAILRYVKEEFECPDCKTKKKPDVSRKTAIPRTYALNRIIAMDTVKCKIGWHFLPSCSETA